MSKHFLTASIVLSAIALLGAGCATYKTTAPTPTDTAAPATEQKPTSEKIVTVGHFVFEPKSLTVSAGEIVVWRHDDNVAHTIVSENLFESPVLERGNEFSFTFRNPGEYEYRCGIHPSMTGKIIVK